jgi:hypothetical protein
MLEPSRRSVGLGEKHEFWIPTIDVVPIIQGQGWKKLFVDSIDSSKLK